MDAEAQREGRNRLGARLGKSAWQCRAVPVLLLAVQRQASPVALTPAAESDTFEGLRRQRLAPSTSVTQPHDTTARPWGD